MKKLNGVIVILMMVAVLMILTDLVLTVFPFHSLAMGGSIELYFIVVSLLTIGIACGLPFFRHKILVVSGSLLNVFFWIGGLLAMFLFYRGL